MPFELADAANMILGAGTAIGAGAFSGYVATSLRSRDYVRAKRGPVEVPFPLPTFPDVVRGENEAREDVAAYWQLQSYHDVSKSMQNKVVVHVVVASATLFAAFAATAAGVTVFKTWAPFHVYSASLDLAALILVVWAFARSGRLRAAWLRHRAESEFLRQWTSTEFLLARGGSAMTAPFDAFLARTQEALKGSDRDVVQPVLAFGRIRIAEIRSAIEAASPVTKDQLRFYLNRRPIQQARWFARSAARISGQNERRAIVMLILFGAALLATAVKLIATLNGSEALAAWAVLVLMIAIGLGTASTSAYLGQNLRSIRHRYAAQVRAIERWFEDHQDLMALASSNEPMSKANMAQLAKAAAAFEVLMIVELADWIAISEDDAMELAPA